MQGARGKTVAAVPEEGSGRRSSRKKKRRSEARKRRCKKKVGGREGRKEIGRVDRIELYGTLIRGRNSEGTGTL